MSRRMNLTFGLRLLYEPVPHAQQGYITMFDPSRFDASKSPIVNADGTITATPGYDPLNGLITNGVNGVPLDLSNGKK